MTGAEPFVATHTEAEQLARFFEEMETERNVRGYGHCCVGCNRNVDNEGHHPMCRVRWWLQRLKQWRSAGTPPEENGT